MAVRNDALTTLARLKAALGVASADTSKDNDLCDKIDQITSDIELETDRKLKVRGYNGAQGNLTIAGSDVIANEDYLFFSGSTLDRGGDTCADDSGYGSVYLPQYPIQPNAVMPFKLGVLVSRDENGETWDDTQLVEWRDYVVEREKGRVRLTGGCFASGYRNYRVTCAAGYKVGSAQPYVPPSLERLCIEMAKKSYHDAGAVTSESIGTWSKSYDVEKANELIDSTIALYRRF